MNSSSTPTAPIIRKLEHDLRNALALAHILPRLLQSSQLDPSSLTPTPKITYPLFEPSSIDPPPIFSAIQLSVWDNITGPRTEAIWTAGGHLSSESNQNTNFLQHNDDVEQRGVLSERVRKAICRRTVDAFEPPRKTKTQAHILENNKNIDKPLLDSLSFPYDRKFNVFPDLDHFVSSCLFVAPLHGHASKFALSFIVNIQYISTFSKGNILKSISEQLKFLSSIIQNLYILAHKRDKLRDTELRIPPLRISLPANKSRADESSKSSHSGTPYLNNQTDISQTRGKPYTSSPQAQNQNNPNDDSVSQSGPLGWRKRLGQQFSPPDTTSNNTQQKPNSNSQSKGGSQYSKQRSRGTKHRKQSSKPSLQLLQNSDDSVNISNYSSNYFNSDAAHSAGTAGLSMNSDAFSPTISPSSSPRYHQSSLVFEHPPSTPTKDQYPLELSPPSSLPTSPRTPKNTYDYLFSPAPLNAAFSKVSTSNTVRFMPGFGQFIIRFILNVYSLFCLHSAPVNPHHITSLLPLSEPCNIEQIQEIFSQSLFEMVESHSSLGSIHAGFISNSVFTSVGPRLPGVSLLPRSLGSVEPLSTMPKKRPRHLFAQPGSLVYDSLWFDFVASSITSHLQTMGRTVVIGSDPDMVEALILTLSFFSHPSNYSQSIGAYEIARNQHTNPPTYRPRRTYSDSFVLQGLVYPTEKHILYLHERMALYPTSPTTWIDIDSLSVRHTPLFARYKRIRKRMIDFQLQQISRSATHATTAALRFEQIVSKYEKTSAKYSLQMREDAIKRVLSQPASSSDQRNKLPIDTTGNALEVGINVIQAEEEEEFDNNLLQDSRNARGGDQRPAQNQNQNQNIRRFPQEAGIPIKSSASSASSSKSSSKRVSVQDLEKITIFFEKSRKTWYSYLNRAAKIACDFSTQFSTISPYSFLSYTQKSQSQEPDEDATFTPFEQDLGPEFLSESQLSELSQHQAFFDDAFQLSGGAIKHGVHPFSRKLWFSSTDSDSSKRKPQHSGSISTSSSSEQLSIQPDDISSFLNSVVSNPRKISSTKDYSGDAFEISYSNLFSLDSDTVVDPDFSLDPNFTVTEQSKRKNKKRRRKKNNIPEIDENVVLPVWKYDEYPTLRNQDAQTSKDRLPESVERSVTTYGNVYCSVLYPLPVPSPWVRGVLETVWKLPLDQRLGFVQQTMSILSQTALLLISTTKSMKMSMNGPKNTRPDGTIIVPLPEKEKERFHLSFNLRKPDEIPNFGFYGVPISNYDNSPLFDFNPENVSNVSNVPNHSNSFASPKNRKESPNDGHPGYTSDSLHGKRISEGDIYLPTKSKKIPQTYDMSAAVESRNRKPKKTMISSSLDESADIPPSIRMAVRRMLNTIPTSFHEMINNPLTSNRPVDRLDADIQSSRQDWLILLAQSEYFSPGVANLHLGETGPGDGTGIDSFHSIRVTRETQTKSLNKLFSEF